MTAEGEKPTNHPKSILLADDDPAMRSLVSDELKEEGYYVIPVADGQEALASVGRSSPDLIITDLRMPHGGMDLVVRLKATSPRTPIVLMTAFGDKDTESLAYKWGASAYFNKPVRMGDLKSAVRRLLDGDVLRRSAEGTT
jgi:DNA-binding response OmpR family regulator